MKKEAGFGDFVKPLAVFPYAFWAIYWYEHGFNWVVGVLGFVLFLIILPAILVLRGKE